MISSEPPSATGVIARPLAASEVPMPEQPQPNSSSIRQPERKSSPGPPYSSGTWVFIKPDLPGLLDDLLRPGAVLVVLPGDLADLLLGEVVRQLAQILLLVGQGEVNHCSQGSFYAVEDID